MIQIAAEEGGGAAEVDRTVKSRMLFDESDADLPPTGRIVDFEMAQADIRGRGLLQLALELSRLEAEK
ncbi:MAG: hypothetical protein V1789_11575 [PVC group bacterium]